MCTISSILMLYCLFWNFWIKISTYKLIHTGKSNYSAKINKKQLSQLPHLPQPGKWTTASKRHQKHQKVTRTTRVSRTRKVKPIWILLKQETVSGNGISWAIVSISLQTDNHASTPPVSFFTGRMPFLPPNQQHQSTEGKCKCLTIYIE